MDRGEFRVPVLRWCILAAAFAFGTAFSADSAGRACVKEKGELGVAYNVHRTKLKEAYAPGGRRLVEGGHQVYEIEVPPLIKRDKPLHCTMSLAAASGSRRSPASAEGSARAATRSARTRGANSQPTNSARLSLLAKGAS